VIGRGGARCRHEAIVDALGPLCCACRTFTAQCAGVVAEIAAQLTITRSREPADWVDAGSSISPMNVSWSHFVELAARTLR